MSLLPAKTLSEIRENCHPGPLKSEAQLDAFYVDTAEARSKNRVLVKELETRLRDRDVARILVYGHRGCGKSTEFNFMCRDLGDDWFPVRVSASEMLPSYGVEAEDVLLAMACSLIKQADAAKLSSRDANRGLKQVEAFFAEQTITTGSSRSADVNSGGGVDTQESFLGKLLGFSVKLEGELKFGKRTENTTIFKVRQNPSELVASVNAIIEAVQEALGTKRKLLIIVEDLDKLNLMDADRVFAKKSPLLAAVQAHIIYTIPIFTLHCPERQAIQAEFPFIKGLPMPKVVALDGRLGPGYDVIHKIILKRVHPDAILPDALDLLIRRTGGVLRDAFEAIVTAASYHRAQIPLSKNYVEAALREMADARALMVAYPPEDPAKIFERRKPEPLFQRLLEIAKRQAKGERVAPRAEPDDQILLSSGAIVEYNDEAWLGVHPLIWSWMKGQKYDMPQDPYGP